MQSNLPPGVTLRDLEPMATIPDFWVKADQAYDRHVERCLDNDQDWRPPTTTSPIPAPVRPCTYPARPINGGAMERALPKTGQWQCEPKYNGWRALVHAPTGTMFNRHGERLSIAREFSTALALVREIHLVASAGVVEWFDCEALERRHGLGRGTLLVFDYIVPGSRESYVERKARLVQVLPVHEYSTPPQTDHACVVAPCGMLSDLEFYRSLKQLNAQWRCPFYEGIVAKRADSVYPVQLRSSTLEFAGWVKHRW